jgi:hypothetical protein
MTSMTRKSSNFYLMLLESHIPDTRYWDDYFKIRLNWNESGKDTGYYSKGKKQAVRNRRIKENDG